jgi:hypothetical protein
MKESMRSIEIVLAHALVVGLLLVTGCASTSSSESQIGAMPANYEDIVRQWHASVERDGNSIFRIDSISPPQRTERGSPLPGWRVVVDDSSQSTPQPLTSANGAPLGVKPYSNGSGSGTFVSVLQDRVWVLTIRDGKIIEAKER